MMLFDNSTRLQDAAVSVASGFLARNEPMTDAVVKVARDNLLNSDQARRVCERANHLVLQALRKTASATAEFDLADPAIVDQKLNRRGKVAMRHFEPSQAVTEKVASDVDEFEKTALDRADLICQERESAREKVAKQEREDVARVASRKYIEAQTNFVEELSKLAESVDDLSEAMECFSQYAPLARHPQAMLKVAQLVKASGLVRFGHRVPFTPETLAVIGSEDGLSKVAAELEPDAFRPGLQISGMPVQVINGRRSIWVSLDTLVNAYESALCAHHAVAQPGLAPDHTSGPRRLVGVTNSSGPREFTVAGRTV